MKRHGRWLIAALGAALLVGAGALAWHLRALQVTEGGMFAPAGSMIRTSVSNVVALSRRSVTVSLTL